MSTYEELDSILDLIEPLLLRLAADNHLLGATVERWRWDEPAIVLAWVDRQNDFVSKSILTSLDEPQAQAHSVTTEVNAWLDELGVRKWWHEDIENIRLMQVDDRTVTFSLRPALQRAYQAVGPVGKSGLTETHALSPQSAAVVMGDAVERNRD